MYEHAQSRPALEVGMMRQEMNPGYEKLMKQCNSMKNIRRCAKTNGGFNDGVTDSMQQPISLLSGVF